jgi:hypothetical protein
VDGRSVGTATGVLVFAVVDHVMPAVEVRPKEGPEMSVVNLQEQFGKRFRISRDPACDAEHKRPEPEQLVIRCRTGAEIYHSAARRSLSSWTDTGRSASASMGSPAATPMYGGRTAGPGTLTSRTSRP